MVRALLVLLVVGEIAHASPEEVADRLEDAIRSRDVAKVTALLARDVTRDGVTFTGPGCRRRAMSRRVLAACLVKEGVADTQHLDADRPTLTFASGVEVGLDVEGTRIAAIVSPSTAPTLRAVVDLYTRVGKKLQALGPSVSGPLFQRYRFIQIQRMLTSPAERARGAQILRAIERDADRR